MAERKGPWDHDTGRGRQESDGQDDRSHVVDRWEEVSGEEANDHRVDSAPVGDTETESTEMKHSTEHDESDSHTAEVVDFTPREEVSLDAFDGDDLVDLDEVEDLVDLSELQADDRLLDALGGTDPSVPDQADDDGPSVELLLVAWRREVDATPIGDLVDIDTAAAAIAAGRPKRGRRRWHLVPVASAAAVLMIACTGVGLAARDALPGDMLWGVAQVLYSDHAKAAEAQEKAKKDLERAQQAWDRGQHTQAEELLDSAEVHMQDVDAEHGLNNLQATHESLAAKFGEPVNPPVTSSSESSTQLPTDSSDLPTSSTSVPSTTDSETSDPTSTPEPTDSTSVPSTSDTQPSSGTSMQDTSGGFLPWPN